MAKIGLGTWLALGAGLALVLGGGGASANGAINVKDTGPGNPQNGKPTTPGPTGALPPAPSIAAVSSPVYTAPSYVPSDATDPATMASTERMTIRQVQAALNLLGATTRLALTGNWDLPTQQAVWDWQWWHQKDNPSSPLNVTGEIDQLTQDSIQAAISKKTGVPIFF